MFERGETPEPDEIDKKHADKVKIDGALKELREKEAKLYRKFRLSGNYKTEGEHEPKVNLAPMLGQEDM